MEAGVIIGTRAEVRRLEEDVEEIKAGLDKKKN
jgi:hypothetical protein